MKAYDLIDTVRCKGTFLSSDVPVDPTTVTFKVKRKDASSTTTYVYGTDAALVKESTGVYHVDFDPTTPGEWFYRYEGVSTGIKTAEEEEFFVKTSQFY